MSIRLMMTGDASKPGKGLPPWLDSAGKVRVPESAGKGDETPPGTALDYARRYAALGWKVFPCHGITADAGGSGASGSGACACGDPNCKSPGKHPLTPHGVKDATGDPETITRWWRQWPEANIAVACGATSGIVVMDVDPRNGGEESLEQLREAGPVPDDCHAQTGGGGWHFVFRYPGADWRFPRLPGIDFQSDGKYVIVEPSMHLTGTAYAWEASSDPLDDETEIPDLPAHLVAPSNGTGLGHGTPVPEDAEWVDPRTVSELRSALNFLRSDDHDDWKRQGMRLKTLGEVGRELWITWSQISEKWEPRDARAWETFKPTQTGYQAIFKEARDRGWTNPQSREAQPDTTSRPAEKLTPIALSSFKDAKIKPRDWLIDGWIPSRDTTAIYADGGTGKTLLIQQLMACVATGRNFFGCDVKQGAALGIFCEDEDDEIHRRQAGINKALGMDWDDLERVFSLCRVGSENLLMTFDSRGRGELTTFWREIRELVGDLRPVLMTFDTRTDAYGGNESDRHQANEFVKRALTSLAKEFDLAVVLTAHPSVTGMTSGMGTSGSTAWNGAVRSRAYLSRDVLTGRVTLELKKANYGPTGSTIDMFWHEGALIPYADATGLMQTTEAAIDQLTLEFIQECTNREINISADKRGNYAPARFIQMARARKIKATAGEFEDALERLFNARKITLRKGFGDTKGRTIGPADSTGKDDA